MHGGTSKWLLRHAYADCLTEEVLTALKKGFEVPVKSRLEGELRPLVLDTVLAPDARVAEFLDHETVRHLFNGELMADRNLASIQYAILILELWLRQSSATRAN